MFTNQLAFYMLIITIQFFSGSIMYSYIFAKLLKVDLRKVRDGNPGSSNLWRVAGWKWGLLALALDYFKGTLPLAIFVGIFGDSLNKFVISIAALFGILGHAFSPMLKFKGGKAIATSFGAWSVLTKWEAPTLLGGVFTIFSIYRKISKKNSTTPEEDALRVFLGYFVLLIYVVWKVSQGALELIILYFGNVLVILYKHKNELFNLLNQYRTKRSERA
ncbi:glycerol-3-phosphate acyltransferase [Fervidobacterium sp.]